MSPKNHTKTLLFVVSSLDVFKQFFFFPGALFDHLKRDIKQGNLKVVFIVPEHKESLKERLSKYCLDVQAEVSIESAPVPEAQSIVEKLFVFWYSYLVYTGTTKTLATMGMRAEDAPGAGRRSLAPIKLLIARTFGRIPWIKRTFVPYLYLKIFSEHPCAGVFGKHHPDYVFAPNLFKQFDMSVLAEAKRKNIPSIGMTTNWDHLDKYFLPFHVDTLLVQSEQIKQFALTYQAYFEKQIIMVGYPYFDFLVNDEYTKTREETLEDLSLPPDARYIFYVAGSMYCPDEPDIIGEMIQWLEKEELGENTYIAIRPYFGGRGKDLAFDEKKFKGFKENPRVSFVMEKFWEDLDKTVQFINILRHADVVMAIYSTAALEAMALDRPSLTLAFDGYKERPFNRSVLRFQLREHFKDILESGGQQRAVSFEHLKQLLIDYLEDPNKDVEKREDLRQRAVYPLGGASNRIYEALQRI